MAKIKVCIRKIKEVDDFYMLMEEVEEDSLDFYQQYSIIEVDEKFYDEYLHIRKKYIGMQNKLYNMV